MTGTVLPAERQLRDLGMDHKAEHKPHKKVASARASAAAKRVHSAKSMGIERRVRQKLFTAGAQPKAAYHTQAAGATPTEIKRIRALAHTAVSRGKTVGRSATVDIALTIGKSKDPTVTTVINLCREWFKWRR